MTATKKNPTADMDEMIVGAPAGDEIPTPTPEPTPFPPAPTPEPEPKPLPPPEPPDPLDIRVAAGVATVPMFQSNNQDVVTPSTAKYIYAMLDLADKRVLMILTMSHTQEYVKPVKVVDVERMAELLGDDDEVAVAQRLNRLRRIGAIVEHFGAEIANEKVAARVSTRV